LNASLIEIGIPECPEALDAAAFGEAPFAPPHLPQKNCPLLLTKKHYSNYIIFSNRSRRLLIRQKSRKERDTNEGETITGQTRNQEARGGGENKGGHHHP
jgi:hypothetical protein